MFIVTVRFSIREGCEARFLEAVHVQSKTSLALEPECTQFDVCVSADRPRDVFLYEAYTSAAAFDEHVKTGHFARFSSLTQDWVDAKVVETWTLSEA